MVVIKPGDFVMGSPDEEAGRYEDESPRHQVIFRRPFALGQREITVAEFRSFIDDTGYITDAEYAFGSRYRDPDGDDWIGNDDLNWRFDHLGNPSRDDNPVVHVSWYDANAYTAWLSKKTGQSYRLPSEAEFEYANRGGTRTVYWWGDGSPSQRVANIRGENDQSVTPSFIWQFTTYEQDYAVREGPTPSNFGGYGDGYGGLAPVASFIPNDFILYDTAGNVWEWTQDCWHDSYDGAPNDGSAWIEEACDMRVLRGGSFYCYPRHVRSANRWSRPAAMRAMYAGFRVARDF
jgi:formylglycine-generating enzyme required for sulfatase activity